MRRSWSTTTVIPTPGRFGDLGEDLDGYARTSGSLHFEADERLPDELVRRLVEAKLRRLGLG
jgi:hypothetical protein